MMMPQKAVWMTVLTLFTLCMLSGCGPSKEEQQRREQARQDSLHKVQMRQQQIQDSLAMARKDSLANANADKMNVSFDEQGNYSVQVEAWRSRRKAQSQIKKWKDRGFDDAFVVQYGNEKTGDVWYRVRLGRLGSRSDAQKLKETLQKRYQAPAWITSVHS